MIFISFVRLIHCAGKNYLYEFLPKKYQFLFCALSGYWLINLFRKRSLSLSRHIKLFLQEMGPFYIKFGQLLSTRYDLFTKELIDELSELQDNSLAFDTDLALAQAKKSLGPLFEDFSEFSQKPIASASIAQVHSALLKGNLPVVMKIRRPDIKNIFISNIKILRKISFIASFIFSQKKYKFNEVIDEVESVVLSETDFVAEAYNALQIQSNFKGLSELYVPKVYLNYSSENLLVMERLFDPNLKQILNSNDYTINFKRLAENGVMIFLMQVFNHGFFHADMHPGNLFINISNPQYPQYRAVDFGMVGSLTDRDLDYLALNLLAFFERDYRKIVMLHVQSGWVLPSTMKRQFELELRIVFDPIFQKPLKDISFSEIVLKLFSIAHKYEMVIQPQLLLLQKTLMGVEGLGRKIYPELDLWATAHPFLEKWIKDRFSLCSVVKRLNNHLPMLLTRIEHSIL